MGFEEYLVEKVGMSQADYAKLDGRAQNYIQESYDISMKRAGEAEAKAKEEKLWNSAQVHSVPTEGERLKRKAVYDEW